MPADKPWACGIFIRERAISCLLGEVETSDTIKFSSHPVPFTRDRTAHQIRDVRCSEYGTPKEALEQAAQLVAQCVVENGLDLRAIHVACFGGFKSLKQNDKHVTGEALYGVLTNVSSYPIGWEGLPLYNVIRDVFASHKLAPQIDVGTNVDAAVFGEFTYSIRNYWKNADESDVAQDSPHHERERELRSIIDNSTWACLSFSRTINIGVFHNGKHWDGQHHPLLAAIRPQRLSVKDDDGRFKIDTFQGTCSYHGDCLEGLIGVEAIEQRANMDFDEIPQNHDVWEYVAFYVAQACVATVATLAPNAILLIGRAFRHLHDYEFAKKLTKRVRGHFYASLRDPKTGEYRPAYVDPVVMPPSEFIRLPVRPKREDPMHPEYGLCGRHGALRLAAQKVKPRNTIQNIDRSKAI